jgi:hypothetical protein
MVYWRRHNAWLRIDIQRAMEERQEGKGEASLG